MTDDFTLSWLAPQCIIGPTNLIPQLLQEQSEQWRFISKELGEFLDPSWIREGISVSRCKEIVQSSRHGLRSHCQCL